MSGWSRISLSCGCPTRITCRIFSLRVSSPASMRISSSTFVLRLCASSTISTICLPCTNWIYCPSSAVHGAVLPPAGAAGTTWRFLRSSPAFFSAFSILLMSKHSHQTHDGERRRKGKCGGNNQRQHRQFLTQTRQLPWTPQVRHDCRHRHLVSLGYRVRETHVRIESQPREKEPEGNQNPEHCTPEHELPESRRIRGRPRSGWFQDFEIRSLSIVVHVY